MESTTGALSHRWNAAWLLLLALKASGLKEGDPDAPVVLQCYWSALNSFMNCSWFTRDPPGVNAICVLHYQSLKFHPGQNHSATAQSEQNWLLIGQSKLIQGDAYSVWVEVHTATGTTTSNKLNFSLDEIVKPPPPDVDPVDPAECDSDGAGVTWQNPHWPSQQQNLICALRYKASKDQGWTYLHQDHVGQQGHYLEDLKPFTSYEVQARCFPEKGFWSEWSPSQTFRTLEAAPLGQVDVWQHVDVSENQKRLLLWKALDPEAARGNILDYEVSYRNHGEDVVKGTWPCCKAILPCTADHAWVSARNSVKKTLPANLSLQQAGKALPGPEEVQVLAKQGLGLKVTWKPSMSPLWVQPEAYVVEWREELHGKNEMWNWTRTPGRSDGALLRDNFMPKLPYLVYVYALYAHGNSASDPVRAYIKEGAPSNCPQALKDRSISSTASVISWEEIPLVDRNGHITHYTLYLRQGASRSFETYKTIGATKRSHRLLDLTPGTTYQLRITGSTSAGEGRPSPVHDFRTPGSHWLLILIVLLAVGFLLTVALAVALAKRKWIGGCCRKILPPCCWEDIPDPGHCGIVQNIDEQSIALGMDALSEGPALSPEGMDIIELMEPAPRPETPPASVAISGYEKRFMPTLEELEKLA